MRSVVRTLAPILLLLLALSLMPSATMPPLRTTPTGPPVVFEMFVGPPEPGVFLFYQRGHCPDAYLLRVSGTDANDLIGLWQLWREFRTDPRPRPGVTVAFHGFPWWMPGAQDPVAGVRDPFTGFATEVLFRTSPTARDLLDFKYEVVPTGDSALVSDNIVRPLVPAPPLFWLGGDVCF